MGNVVKSFERIPSGKRNLILLGLGALLVGGVYAGVNQVNNPQTQTPPGGVVQQVTSGPENITPYTIVYGLWSDNNSLIKAFDLETKDNYELAVLPQNVKRVTAVMPDTLYYINNTNENDHGTEVIKYSISGKTNMVVASAETEFGIDDYYVSPDGRYLTTWEVDLAQGTDQLNGGNSRVYSVDMISGTAKNLLYDEQADKPVHYPRGITNNGTVITDMFLPNSGPGWAYGMGSSDFTGASKKDITVMANGTYGRQPRMSYDGTQLAFVGYDGVNGAGTEQITGIRRAVIHPNTIEVLSSESLQRTKLPGLSDKFVFDDVRFDPSNRYLFASQVKYANPGFVTDVRLFNLADNSTMGIPSSENKRGFAMLSDSQALVSTPLVTGQTMGNLGETYQFINSGFEVINIKDGQTEIVPIPDSNIQYVGVFPSSSTAFGNKITQMSTDTLQLHTFILKPKLMTDRINLQARSNITSKVYSPQLLANSSVKGIKILAQVLTGTPVPSQAVTNTPAPSQAVTNTPVPSQAVTNTPAPSQAVSGTPAPTITSGGPTLTPGASGTPAPTGGAGTGTPNPSISIPANIQQILDRLRNGELTPEMIEELISWLQNLLGIQEQETQN